jgi:hypothetical protein
MSLRAFHIVFIVVSVALSAFVAAWGLREYRTAHSNGALALAAVFFVGGVTLVAYGVHAAKKYREME